MNKLEKDQHEIEKDTLCQVAKSATKANKARSGNIEGWGRGENDVRRAERDSLSGLRVMWTEGV